MNKPKKLDKKQLLSAFKADLQAATTDRETIDAKIEQWKSEYNGEPYGNETKGKSSIVSRDIKRQSDWQHSSIIDPFVGMYDMIKANPITWEDKDAAVQNELVLNTQFCRQFDRYNFMSKAVKVLDIEGTAVVQTGWDYKDEEEEVEVPKIEVDENGFEYINGTETITQTKVLVNKPTAKVCRNEDVFIDPTCQDDLDNCQFVIYRYETDLSTLRQDGRYKNLNSIRVDSNDESGSSYESEDESNFKFEDDPRKKLLVHEYWGNYDVNNDGIAEAIVCAWVNDTVIRLQSNPYPDKKPPFLVVPFNSVPFQLHGESNAELISDNQKIKTAITRGIIDNMAQSNNGQQGIRKGALDTLNRKKFLNRENFEFNGSPGDFYSGSYNQIPGTAFDVLNMQDSAIESITGTKGFSNGMSTGSLGGGSATAARGVLDASSVRRMNTVRNIAENLIKPLMRKWMSYNSEFLSEEEVFRITNDEFVTVKRDDLAGRIDIDIQVATAEDNAVKAEALNFQLQTGASTMDAKEVRMVRAEIARLSKLPEFAKEIEEYQPEPDHRAEEIHQLTVMKLKREIAKIESETAENIGDEAEKLAAAELKAAQTRKLHAESDKIDLDFVKTDSGTDHSNEMEKKEFDRLASLDAMSFQVINGSDKEQIGVA